MKEQWMVANKKADFKGIGRCFGIDQVTARIIRNRDVITEEEIRLYLEGSLADLPDPHLLKDGDLLVELLSGKIKGKQKIRIIGDYDIDGVMSSYVLFRGLTRVGAAVDVAIPNRITDGYGLNRNLIDDARESGVDTIITCDNGIAAREETAYAKELGMTVLLTDHHAIPFAEKEGENCEILPQADAIVNPHRKACRYPYKELCGAAVAWLVVEILYEKMGIDRAEAEELLEFVSFATVGDVVSLTGVNRILVKEGLKRIRHTKNIGMRALIAQCQLSSQQVDSYHFGFVLGPCINAAGRLETAQLALSLFRTDDEQEAVVTANRLVALNDERKLLTQKGVEAAVELYEKGDYDRDPVLVMYLPEVDESIAGVIAGRIREYYYRPTFILTRAKEGVKGSGRSIEEYSMYEQMCQCAELFTRFGGHPMAAGLSLPEENVELFRRKINQCCPFTVEELTQKIHIDVPMPVDYVTTELVHELALLAPFGKDNPKPLFADKNLRVKRLWVVGKNQNVLRLTLVSGGSRQIAGVLFGGVEEFMDYVREQFGEDALTDALHGRENAIRLSIVYSTKLDTYRDTESLQFVISSYR